MRIGHALDGDSDQLSDLLVWMPAHQTLHAVGSAKSSDGELLTAIDWRANRLVDAMAKLHAHRRLPSSGTATTLRAARLAARHAAQQLGQVTHAANNAQRSVRQEDGSTTTVTVRDAAPGVRHPSQGGHNEATGAPHVAQLDQLHQAPGVVQAVVAAPPAASSVGSASGPSAAPAVSVAFWTSCGPTPIPGDRVRKSTSEPHAGRTGAGTAASRQAAARRDATLRRAADAASLRGSLARAAAPEADRPALPPGRDRFAALQARVVAKCTTTSP